MSGRQSNSVVAALQQAAMALRSRQFETAQQLAAQILKSNRADRNATLILAHALIGQRRPAEAVAPLEKAARRGDDAEIETLLGAALCQSRRAADGIAQLRRTAARRPPYLPAFQELAGQLAKAGQLDEAITAIEDGIVLAPASVDLKLDLGRLFLQGREHGKARAVLENARDAAPERADILTELARALLYGGEYAAAADALRHVLGRKPDDALARANLATCLLELGERNDGEATLRSILRGQPQLLGRVAFALASSSHGRFFFRPSAAAKFLDGELPRGVTP